MNKKTAEWEVELQSEERSFACQCPMPGNDRIDFTEEKPKLEAIDDEVNTDGKCEFTDIISNPISMRCYTFYIGLGTAYVSCH